MSSSPSPPPRDLEDLSPNQTAKRDAIIAAAVEVLLDAGVHACTVRAIADRAGVSKGIVHYYFGEVDQVVDAAMSQATRAWISWFREGGVADFWRSIDALLEPFAQGDRALMPLWLEYWALRTRAGKLAPLREMQALLLGFVADLLVEAGCLEVEEKAAGVTAYLFGIAMHESTVPLPLEVIRRQVGAMCGLPAGT